MLESLALAPPHWQRLGDAQQLLWIPKKTDNLCHETCLTVCRGGRSGAGETFTRSVFAIAFSGLSALLAHFLHGPGLTLQRLGPVFKVHKRSWVCCLIGLAF